VELVVEDEEILGAAAAAYAAGSKSSARLTLKTRRRLKPGLRMEA
jgi:hypothetical protein